MPAPRAPRLLSASRRSADLALLRRRVERSWAAGEGPDQEVSHARRHARRRPLGSRQRRLAMFRALQHLHKAPAFRINRTHATPRRMRAWTLIWTPERHRTGERRAACARNAHFISLSLPRVLHARCRRRTPFSCLVCTFVYRHIISFLSDIYLELYLTICLTPHETLAD